MIHLNRISHGQGTRVELELRACREQRTELLVGGCPAGGQSLAGFSCPYLSSLDVEKPTDMLDVLFQVDEADSSHG